MTPDARLFVLLAEQLTDYAVFLLDVEGRIMSWNSGARLITGYRADEIIGRHFSIFYPKDAVKSAWPEHELHIAATEGRFEDENYRVRKDGSRFWANVIITALRDEDGKLLAFSKITRDLTKRHAREEELTHVAAGGSVLDPAATRAVGEKEKGLASADAKVHAADPLSSQEKNVLALVAAGKTNKEIAIALGLSHKTVKNYLHRIFEKLHVGRRALAAVLYRQSHPE